MLDVTHYLLQFDLPVEFVVRAFAGLVSELLD
jgi:hypothetical protein